MDDESAGLIVAQLRYLMAEDPKKDIHLYVNSPAVSAGLRAGDILLAVDGHEVRNAQDALTQLAGHKPGGSAKLRVQRGLKVQEVECRVVERPNQI